MTHVVYDITGCSPLDRLTGRELMDAMRQTAYHLGCTPRGELVESFEPFGHTCVLVLSESHITVSTWPEIGLTHIDVFTCRADAAPGEAIKPLLELLGGQITHTQRVPRLAPDWCAGRSQ